MRGNNRPSIHKGEKVMLGTTILNETSVDETASSYGYRDSIVAAQKVNWRIEEIIGGDKRLDFSKRFMPDSLVRIDGLGFLNEDEKRVLNQIKGHTYLSIFGVVEEFILPFVLDHVRPSLDQDDYRVRAFLQFASEEAKHIQLFKVFCEEFDAGFGTECKVIGPASEIGSAVLSHQPLAVALLILGVEWATQRHYVDSVKDDGTLDPQFRSLLKNHWLEEAQHAKLDTAMVLALAENMGKKEVENAIDEFLEIGGFLDAGFRQQTLFELEAFEAATGRTLNEAEREEFVTVQHQANRWTYIGSALTHAKFLETVGSIDAEQRARIQAVAPTFC
jgi:hypothetical protein